MQVYFLTNLSREGLWLWIADKQHRIFCARVNYHGEVLILAQKQHFEVTTEEVVGGGEFYLISKHKSVVSFGRSSGEFGIGPDEADRAIKDYFLSEGWSL